MSPSRRILIVEDEPNVRLVFRTALATESCAIAAADDGEQALRWLRGNVADLILLDLNLPKMGGLDVLRRLGEEGERTPVVVVTAHGSITVAVEAMKLGAIDFLEKPATPTELRRVVDAALSRGSGRKSPPRPDPIATLRVRAHRALEDGDLAKAKVLVDGLAALEPDSAEVRRLVEELRSAREASDGPDRIFRGWFP